MNNSIRCLSRCDIDPYLKASKRRYQIKMLLKFLLLLVVVAYFGMMLW